MRMATWLCIASFSAFVITANATDIDSSGPCTFGKETIADPLCYGPTTLAETTVTGKILVAGELDATHSSLGSIEVAGITNMDDSSAKGNTHLMGTLAAHNSAFEGDLSIDSDNATLTDSIVTGSVIINSEHAAPLLELSCGTTVAGNITFKGQPGIVKKSTDSTIEGKVINGSVEKSMTTTKCE